MDKIILLISRSNGLNYRDILKDVKWYYSMYGIISIKDRTSYADSDEIANAIKIAYPDLGINVSKYMDNNNNINENENAHREDNKPQHCKGNDCVDMYQQTQPCKRC